MDIDVEILSHKVAPCNTQEGRDIKIKTQAIFDVIKNYTPLIIMLQDIGDMRTSEYLRNVLVDNGYSIFIENVLAGQEDNLQKNSFYVLTAVQDKYLEVISGSIYHYPSQVVDNKNNGEVGYEAVIIRRPLLLTCNYHYNDFQTHLVIYNFYNLQHSKHSETSDDEVRELLNNIKQNDVSDIILVGGDFNRKEFRFEENENFIVNNLDYVGFIGAKQMRPNGTVRVEGVSIHDILIGEFIV